MGRRFLGKETGEELVEVQELGNGELCERQAVGEQRPGPGMDMGDAGQMGGQGEPGEG